MRNIKNNKKGFTLMELLAVIVILSVLILLAMPAVLRLMENARKNAFQTETESLVKIAQTAYTNEAANSSYNGKTKICYTLDYLTSAGYTEKKFETGAGSIQIDITDSTNIEYKVWYKSGAYAYNGNTFDEVKDGKTATNASLPLAVPATFNAYCGSASSSAYTTANTSGFVPTAS